MVGCSVARQVHVGILLNLRRIRTANELEKKDDRRLTRIVIVVVHVCVATG